VERDVPARWRCQRTGGGLRPQLAGDVEFHLQGKTLEPDEKLETKPSVPPASQAPWGLGASLDVRGSNLTPASETFAVHLKQAAPAYQFVHVGKCDIAGSPGQLGCDESDGPLGNADGNSEDADDPKWIFWLTERANRWMRWQTEKQKPFFFSSRTLRITHRCGHTLSRNGGWAGSHGDNFPARLAVGRRSSKGRAARARKYFGHGLAGREISATVTSRLSKST